VKQQLQQTIIEALKDEQQVLECDLKELASTLLVAAIKDDTFFLLHVGDGVIGYVKDEQLHVASKPSNGEFSNSTVFVTSSRLIENMNLIKGTLKASISAFVLMSDGTAESFYEKSQQRLAPVVKRLIDWTALLTKQNMLDIVSYSFDHVIAAKTLDDCSIAIITNQQNMVQKYTALNMTEKYRVLQLPTKDSRTLKKKVLRYDAILRFLAQPKTLDEVAKEIRLKRKHTKKRMTILMQSGLITQRDGYYIAK
ncbi:MAG: PP2C family serine/threonine-protein phosphatase, partial [Caryophanon sp.]|nr:PP2C family serine/threonine-protein phosphatase [Caryophanon sp.]